MPLDLCTTPGSDLLGNSPTFEQISEAKRASNQVNHSILSDIQKCIDAMLAIQQT